MLRRLVAILTFSRRPDSLTGPAEVIDGDTIVVQATADYAGVSTQSVRRWIKAGHLKIYRAGRQIRIDESDLSTISRPRISSDPQRKLASCRSARQAGAAKLPGLVGVARHSGVRSLLASDSARRTPSASKSLV